MTEKKGSELQVCLVLRIRTRQQKERLMAYYKNNPSVTAAWANLVPK